MLDVQDSHRRSLHDLSTGDVDESSTLHEEDVQVEADRRYCNGLNERQLVVWVSWIAVLDGMTKFFEISIRVLDCSLWAVGGLASELVDGRQNPGLVRWFLHKLQQMSLVVLGTFTAGRLEGIDAAEQTEDIGCDGSTPEPMLRTERYLELRFVAG